MSITGRPPRADVRMRNYIMVKVSAQELEQVKLNAQAQGKTVSDYIRDLALGKKKKTCIV